MTNGTAKGFRKILSNVPKLGKSCMIVVYRLWSQSGECSTAEIVVHAGGNYVPDATGVFAGWLRPPVTNAVCIAPLYEWRIKITRMAFITKNDVLVVLRYQIDEDSILLASAKSHEIESIMGPSDTERLRGCSCRWINSFALKVFFYSPATFK